VQSCNDVTLNPMIRMYPHDSKFQNVRSMFGAEGQKRHTSSSRYAEPWEISSAGKCVILGIGNPYMHDDAVGMAVAAELRKRDLGEKTVVYDYQAMDLSLLMYFKDCSKIVLVDAFTTGGIPGTVSAYSIRGPKNSLPNLPNQHELQLHEIVDVAGETGILSCQVVVVGIEPKDCSPGEGLSDEVKEALPRAINAVMNELNQPGE
jgi:hydrogenase maturation protease